MVPARQANGGPDGARPPGMTRLFALLALVALAAVSGCADGRAAARAPADPFALVGSWRVAGTEQRMHLDPSAFEIVDGCRTLIGTWRADPGGRFVAAVDGVLPCPDGSGADPASPGWPGLAGGFAVEGPDRVLRDRSGGELVRLQPDPSAPGSGTVEPGREPTPEERRAAGAAAPLAPGLVPAEPAGRWGGPGGSFVEFAADGSWTGSDGCNGAGGSWVAGPDGAFLAAAPSVRTLIACDGLDVATALTGARTVGLDGETLVLLDVAGAELGRLDRA